MIQDNYGKIIFILFTILICFVVIAADNTTHNMALPRMYQGQTSIHTSHNTTIRILDSLLQRGIQDKELYSPPISPASGDVWIVAVSTISIVSVSAASDIIYVTGDLTNYLSTTEVFNVSGSSAIDGILTASAVVYNSTDNQSSIETVESLSASTDGEIEWAFDDWNSYQNYLAHFYDYSWHFLSANEGWIVWLNDEDKMYLYNNSVWNEYASVILDLKTSGTTILGTSHSQSYNLLSNQVNIWLDELHNSLLFKVKDSTGTIRSGTVQLY